MKYRIVKYSFFILDILFVLFAFLFAAKIRPGSMRIVLKYYRSLVPFLIIWIGSGVWGLKFSLKSAGSGLDYIRRIFKCNLVAIVTVLAIMYLLGKFYYSRYIVFSTIVGTFALELFVFVGIYYAFRFHKENATFAATKLITRSKALEESQSPKFFLETSMAIPVISSEPYHLPSITDINGNAILLPLWQKYLADKRDLFEFLNDFLDLTRFSRQGLLILNTETYYNIKNEAEGSRQDRKSVV